MCQGYQRSDLDVGGVFSIAHGPSGHESPGLTFPESLLVFFVTSVNSMELNQPSIRGEMRARGATRNSVRLLGVPQG